MNHKIWILLIINNCCKSSDRQNGPLKNLLISVYLLHNHCSMSESPPPLGDICCVFTDIIDSTTIWEYNQRAMQAALTIHDSILRTELFNFGGYEVKPLGDGFLATFSKPESALKFCLSTQRKLQGVKWPKEISDHNIRSAYWNGHSAYQFRGLQVRMGIHFGAPFTCSPNQLTGRMDYYGYTINIAARIHREAKGDEIALSDDFIAELYRCRTGQKISVNYLTHRLRSSITSALFEDEKYLVRSKGLQSLKGVHSPLHIFLIVMRS
jgi:class 3 adenylate cyclase